MSTQVLDVLPSTWFQRPLGHVHEVANYVGPVAQVCGWTGNVYTSQMAWLFPNKGAVQIAQMVNNGLHQELCSDVGDRKLQTLFAVVKSDYCVQKLMSHTLHRIV